MKSNKIFSIALSVFVSFVFVFAVTFAASTISTNISTGGTLTVTGASTQTGAVTMGSTLGVTGLTTLGNASTSQITTSGNLWVNGFATTTASNGNFATLGTLVGSSTLQVTGATTLYNTLNVTGLSTLGNASSTMLTVTGNTYLATTTLSSGGSLTLGTLAADPSGTNGQMYYSTGSGAIRVYQGGSWTTLGAANGWTDGGTTVYPTAMADQFLIGTTSVSGLSQLTVEATSTAGIPLTLRGYNGQTANLFQIQNVGSTNLFAIDSLGRLANNLSVNGYATTTASNGNFATLGTLVGSSTLQVTGATTLYSTLNVTGLTTLGNASTTNVSASGALWVGGNATTTTAGAISTNSTLNVTGLTTLGNASTTNVSASGALWVGGNATTTTAGAISTNGSLTLANSSTAINGIVFGFCNIANSGNITASSTGYFNCTGATGVTTSHRVFVQATSSLPTNLIVVAASSTAQDTINLLIYNTGTTGLVAPGAISLNFFGIR